MPARSSIYIKLYTPAAEKPEALRMSLHTGGHRHGNDTETVYEPVVKSNNGSRDERGNNSSVDKVETGNASSLDPKKSVEMSGSV
ncbi:hypothetical protein SBOR_5217 [Sclerotinia borealis F-4128]|uniref:Uncharacterized protein n=1 Tax=Sclerotinia borealis (strain F-4128) TaxID=1432307 RepID=W9CIC5_SCLBF|nr:hypothetical protein SBOR_5217 [Sclerotinia borealis F-4128]